MNKELTFNGFNEIEQHNLTDINGGIAPLIVVGLLLVPVVGPVVGDVAEAAYDGVKNGIQKAYQSGYNDGYRKADDEIYIRNY